MLNRRERERESEWSDVCCNVSVVIESVCGELVRLELGLKSWERLSLYNAQELLFFCIFSYCCGPLPWLNHTDFSPRV